jgi:hypothetical protein
MMSGRTRPSRTAVSLAGINSRCQLVTRQAFLCSIAIALTLLIAADGRAEVIVETSHATIESKKGQRLRVLFSAVVFRPGKGSWDWPERSQLVVPVENPGDRAVLTRRSAAAVDGHDRRIFTGTCRP